MREQYFIVKEESFSVLSTDRKSISSYIVSEANDETYILPDDFVLPDEDFYAHVKDDRLTFADGFFDGVYLFEMATIDAEESHNMSVEVLARFMAYAEAKDEEKKEKAFLSFYKRVAVDDTIEYMEDILDDFHVLINKEKTLMKPYEELAFELMNAHHRGALKFAIYMMVFIPLNDDGYRFIEILGSCEELAYPVSVLFRHKREESDGNERLFRLAKRASGWGRVFYIYAMTTTTKAMKEWLISHALDEGQQRYLTSICEESSEMLLMLSTLTDNTNMNQRAIYRGAGRIIGFFITGEALSTPKHLNELIEQFVALSRDFCHTIEGYETLAEIYDYIYDDEYFSVEKQKSIGHAVQKIFYSERAKNIAREGLRDNSQVALRLGRHMGIDLWDDLFMFALSDDKFDDWFTLTLTEDIEQYSKLCAFAEGRMPLAYIGSGMGEELGLEGKYDAHMSLLFVIQGLKKFDKIFGIKLLLTALNSPVVNNRNMALGVVKAGECVPKVILGLLEENYDLELNEDALEIYEEIFLKNVCRKTYL